MQPRVADIVDGLAARADDARAIAMARYMKSTMPFYGVARPALDGVVRAALARRPIVDGADYREAVEQLWALPHREEKYAAIAIARRQRRFVSMDHLDLYRRMIVEGAWWDLVDDLAHIIGMLLLADRDAMRPVLDRWIDDDDLWLRRTALLSQLAARDRTDAAMLFDHCARRLHEREFFIRKAIGWALRQYARTAPQDVRMFCLQHRQAMSGLSYREAMKHLAPLDEPRTGAENPQKP